MSTCTAAVEHTGLLAYLLALYTICVLAKHPPAAGQQGYAKGRSGQGQGAGCLRVATWARAENLIRLV